MTEKVKRTSGPDKTATWIWLEDGQFKVDYYDFSNEAHAFFGNDIAWTIKVNEMEKLYSIINKDKEYFKSYFGIKQWLEENEVEFNVERESWVRGKFVGFKEGLYVSKGRNFLCKAHSPPSFHLRWSLVRF